MAKFSRTVRLKKNNLRLNQPKKITNKYFLILFKRQQLSYARLGIIVGKKYVKRAVDRNQIKRIVRESFRQHQEKLKNLDIVVIVRSECSTLSTKVWRNDIDNIWQILVESLKVSQNS